MLTQIVEMICKLKNSMWQELEDWVWFIANEQGRLCAFVNLLLWFENFGWNSWSLTFLSSIYKKPKPFWIWNSWSRVKWERTDPYPHNNRRTNSQRDTSDEQAVVYLCWSNNHFEHFDQIRTCIKVRVTSWLLCDVTCDVALPTTAS